MQIRKILVPFDSCENSEKALRWATGMAEKWEDDDWKPYRGRTKR